MAIEQGTPPRALRTGFFLVLFAVLLLVAAFTWFQFFWKQPEAERSVGEASSEVFDKTFFEDARWKRLTLPSGIRLPENPPVGKPNPFAPLVTEPEATPPPL